MKRLTARPAWKALTAHYKKIEPIHLREMFAADPKRSIREADRRFYTKEYARKDGMRAGFEVFRAFEGDAKDFAEFSKTKLKMPMLVLTGKGEKTLRDGNFPKNTVIFPDLAFAVSALLAGE